MALTHGFDPKRDILQLCSFLGNIGQENVFYDILERTNAFLGYNNKKFKKSKNWHYSKGVNQWFWSKNGHFSNWSVFFIKYWPAKFLLRYSRAIKRLSKLSNKKWKNWHFTHGFGPKMAIFRTFYFRQYWTEKCLLRYSGAKKRLLEL